MFPNHFYDPAAYQAWSQAAQGGEGSSSYQQEETPPSSPSARDNLVAADADIVGYRAHFCQRKRLALLIHPGVLHRTSFVKYAAAFLRNMFTIVFLPPL